ncbi:MAG: hypothetical protein U5J95_00500 [Balneolaceae bacterium]|nr:hypothetical protein [Balneolaceae bacterium]
MKKKYVFWVASVFFGMVLAIPTQAQNAYQQKLDKGIQAFYQTDWDSAGTIFDELKQDNNKDPRAFFFDAMIPFWEYFFAGQNARAAEQFLQLSAEAIEKSNSRLRENPHDTTMVLMLSGLHGYRSLVAAGEKEYRTAIQSGMTGYKYTRQLLALDDDDPKALIGKGIFYYMIGSVPGELRWMTNMMGVKGNKSQGFEILEKAAQTDSYVSNDAKMVLVYLYKEEQRYGDALKHIEDLRSRYTNNIIFQFNYAELLEKVDQPLAAREAYQTVMNMENRNLRTLKMQSRARLQQF